MKLTEEKTINPLGDYLFIEVYTSNPYKELKKGILITSTSEIYEDGDGMEGNKVEMEKVIKCGRVIDAGPNCTTVDIDNEVYFDSRGAVPVPVGDLGIVRVSEKNIIAFIK